ncbi:MauE/DoxX family redox-associated membrane protein [Pedobacter sp. KR3-3]|uniref:MauE/DoxX family redox-associated membrane protein n=1 Tax=Pedobacter albus TaxID=3113905 RepID=A0ABU7IAD4_9SPHI|nr:MauE/DoxX family redox-associated membrane protein [Pedobacter sp. KR3-3]MEE1946426.1 MauE/DoxX family redox-associated membrane protein [Pedobacter sp. KR3-3]
MVRDGVYQDSDKMPILAPTLKVTYSAIWKNRLKPLFPIVLKYYNLLNRLSMFYRILYQFSCFLLVLLFLYTASSKLVNFDRFYFDMGNQVFPKSWRMVMVVAIPSIELVTAIALLFPRSRKTGLIASLALMSVFTLYTSLVLTGTFDRMPCSCGGVIRSLTWPQHLIFNLFFVGITLLALWLHNKTDHRQLAVPAS